MLKERKIGKCCARGNSESCELEWSLKPLISLMKVVGIDLSLFPSTQSRLLNAAVVIFIIALNIFITNPKLLQDEKGWREQEDDTKLLEGYPVSPWTYWKRDPNAILRTLRFITNIGGFNFGHLLHFAFFNQH